MLRRSLESSPFVSPCAAKRDSKRECSMGQRLSTEAMIFGKLVAMTLAKHGVLSWIAGPSMILARLEELGVTPDKPDNEIRAALEGLVDERKWTRE